MDSKKWYVIRCDRAGVFFAHVTRREHDEADLENARRLWFWDGAASLSQLAMEGVKKPQNCKFTVPVSKMTVLGVIELIECTEEAVKSIQEVKPWAMRK